MCPNIICTQRVRVSFYYVFFMSKMSSKLATSLVIIQCSFGAVLKLARIISLATQVKMVNMQIVKIYIQLEDFLS